MNSVSRSAVESDALPRGACEPVIMQEARLPTEGLPRVSVVAAPLRAAVNRRAVDRSVVDRTPVEPAAEAPPEVVIGVLDEVSADSVMRGPEEVEAEIADEIGVQSEADVIARVSEAEIDAADLDTFSSVLESLTDLHQEVTSLVASGKATEQTAVLARMAAQSHLHRVHMKLSSVSLESVVVSGRVLAEHQMVLEGMSDAIKRIKQAAVVDFKRVRDAFLSNEESLAEQNERQEKILKSGKEELLSKKASFKDAKHEGSLTEVWRFFSNEKGPRVDFVAAIKEDVALANYIAHDYPMRVFNEIDTALNLLHLVNLDEDAPLLALVRKLEKLKSPVELFDSRYLVSGRPYLNVMGLEVHRGTANPTLTLAGQSLPRLAALATPSRVVESTAQSGYMEKRVKDSGRVLGAAVEYTTADIGTIFDLGLGYVKSHQMGVADAPRVREMFKKLDVAFEAIFQKTSATDSMERLKVMSQIYKFLGNYWAAVGPLVTTEFVRSIRGARYCGYLGLRLISNAS